MDLQRSIIRTKGLAKFIATVCECGVGVGPPAQPFILFAPPRCPLVCVSLSFCNPRPGLQRTGCIFNTSSSPLPCLPQGRVVSGHMSALTLVSEAATAGGALKAAMLAVAGAFHTDLMRPASQALTQAGGEERRGKWRARRR